MGKRRIEVTLESERLYVVSRRHSSPVLWCDGCNRKMPMLNVEQAAMILRSSSRAVFRLVESGRLHSEETGEGKLYICLNSLASLKMGE